MGRRPMCGASWQRGMCRGSGVPSPPCWRLKTTRRMLATRLAISIKARENQGYNSTVIVRIHIVNQSNKVLSWFSSQSHKLTKKTISATLFQYKFQTKQRKRISDLIGQVCLQLWSRGGALFSHRETSPLSAVAPAHNLGFQPIDGRSR